MARFCILALGLAVTRLGGWPWPFLFCRRRPLSFRLYHAQVPAFPRVISHLLEDIGSALKLTSNQGRADALHSVRVSQRKKEKERRHLRAVVQIRPFEFIFACARAFQPSTQALLSHRVRVVLDTDADNRAGHSSACILTISCESEGPISMQRGRETDMEWIHGTCFRVL